MMVFHNSWIQIEADYLFREALNLSRKGKYDAALKRLLHVVVLAPRYIQAILEMGNCLAMLGRYEEAIARYELALKLDPANASAWSCKGRLLQKIGRSQEGQICIDKAASIASA